MPPKRSYEEVGGTSAKERKKQRVTEARSISTQSGQASGVATNSALVLQLESFSFFFKICLIRLGLSGLPGAIDVEKFVEASLRLCWQYGQTRWNFVHRLGSSKSRPCDQLGRT